MDKQVTRWVRATERLKKDAQKIARVKEAAEWKIFKANAIATLSNFMASEAGRAATNLLAASEKKILLFERNPLDHNNSPARYVLGSHGFRRETHNGRVTVSLTSKEVVEAGIAYLVVVSTQTIPNRIAQGLDEIASAALTKNT